MGFSGYLAAGAGLAGLANGQPLRFPILEEVQSQAEDALLLLQSYFVCTVLQCDLPTLKPAFRIHIHRIWIRIQPKISIRIRIQKGLESGSRS